MREKWAIFIVLSTGLIVFLLAMLFALIQNPQQRDTTVQIYTSEKKASGVNSSQFEEGRKIYLQNNCAMCHSIAGLGNPRNPLDNISTRRSAEEIRQWITASEGVKDSLPASIRKTKQRYQALSDHELDALVSYLRN